MTIAEAREKCKALVGKIPRDGLIIGVLLATSTLSFGLGYLAGLDVPVPDIADALSSEEFPVPEGKPAPATAKSAAGRYVASKNGTKYYLPTCSGADRIVEANKVWFASAEAAVTAGYSPAANCDGI